MPRSKSEIPRRAQSYAAGQVRTGGHHVGDHGPLATGWRAGYRAALQDIRRIVAHSDADGDSTADTYDLLLDFLNPRRRK